MITSTSPENAADVEILRDMLLAVSIGQTLTYTAMSQRLGRDVKDRRWLLGRAIKEAEADSGGLFTTVRGEGIQRLPSDQVPNVGLASIQKIRRTAKRGFARLSTVRVNDLPEREQHTLLAHRSMLGAIHSISDGRRAPAVAKEAAVDGRVVSAGRVLDLLRSKE